MHTCTRLPEWTQLPHGQDDMLQCEEAQEQCKAEHCTCACITLYMCVYNTGQSCVSVPSSHNMHTYVSNRDWSVHVGSTSWLEFLLTF